MFNKNLKSIAGQYHGVHVGLLLMVLAPFAWGQSVPADLLDLSLEDLFSANVAEDSKDWLESNRWNFQYRFQRSDFEGYLDGSRKLSNDEVLFSPGAEARTTDNFPVVPTVIEQKVHALVVGYDLNERVTLSLALPYIEQSTDHISIVPGYDFFVIDSSGIGDVSLLGTYKFGEQANSSWQFSIGLSVPTGSIDEEGDTPRAAGDQQLPYSMQLGSGTYDIPLSIGHSRQNGSFSWGGELAAKIRTGENDRNYRLGNRMQLSSWVRAENFDWVKPSLAIAYEYTGKIRGMDDSLLVPLAFPFPAPVTNPDLYGGREAIINLGLRFPVFDAGKYIDLEIGKPFYQSLNGPQTKEDYRVGLRFSW